MRIVTVKVGGVDVGARLRRSEIRHSIGEHVLELVLTRHPSGPSVKDDLDRFLGREYEIRFDHPLGKGAGASFKGTVHAAEARGTFIVLRAYGPLHRLDLAGRTRSFVKTTGKAIVQRVLAQSGVPHEFGEYGATIDFDYMAQYAETDLQFVRRLLAYDGMTLFDNGQKLRVVRDFQAEPQIDVTPPDVADWPGELEVRVSPATSTGVAYAYLQDRTADATVPKSPAASGSELHGFAARRSDEVYGSVQERRHREPVLNPSQLRSRLDARARERVGRLVVYRGKLHCTGVHAGVRFKLARNPLIAESLAVVSARILFDLGFYEADVEAVPAGALVSSERAPVPREALDTATVMDNKDPENLGRVRVRFPWDAAGDACPWVRVVQFGAGDQRGSSWTPAVGDRVVVSFEYGDPSRPIVVGSSYHSKARPRYATKNGTEEVLVARTARGTEIRVIDTSGKEEVRILTDAGGKKNELRLRTSPSPEILLKSSAKIVVEAQNIEVKADQKLLLKGTNVEIEAGANLKAGGNRTVIKADADLGIKGSMVGIKGSMVKIN